MTTASLCSLPAVSRSMAPRRGLDERGGSRLMTSPRWQVERDRSNRDKQLSNRFARGGASPSSCSSKEEA